jgi:hypothetical protein
LNFQFRYFYLTSLQIHLTSFPFFSHLTFFDSGLYSTVKPTTEVEQTPRQDTAQMVAPGAIDEIAPELSFTELIELIDCLAKPVSFQGAIPAYPGLTPWL